MKATNLTLKWNCKYIVCLFLSGIAIQLFLGLSLAQSPDSYIFAVEKGIPPFTYLDDDNQITGYGIEALDWLQTQADIQFSYNLDIWDSIVAKLDNNTVDFTYMIKTVERNANYSFSEPLYNFSTRVFVNEEDLLINDLHDLSNKTVSVVEESVYAIYLENHVPDAFPINCTSEEEAILKLASAEVQAAFLGEDSGIYTIQSNGIENIKYVGEPIVLGELTIATKLGTHQEEMENLNTSIVLGKTEKIFSTFRENYLGTKIAITRYPYLEEIILIITIGSLASIGGVSLWNRTLSRKLAQSHYSLTRQKEELDTILENIDEAVIMINNQGNIEYANSAAKQLFKSEEKRIHENFFDFIELYEQNFQEKIIFHQEAGIKQLKDSLPAVAGYYSEEGEERYFLINNSILDHKDQQKGKKGESKALIVLRDITRQQKSYLEEIRQQKIESLGVLAGGIAHDFNNLLSGIMGNFSLISLENPNSTINELVKEGIKASKRAQDLTYQLLTFSKGGKPIKKPQFIEPLLYETATFTSRGSSVRVNFYIEPDLKKVDIDYGQISQVVNNLLINAIQAMKGRKKFEINIFAENVEIGKNQMGLAAGKYLKISIQDFGIGISKANIHKIFDPYYTTKSSGNGLGLAISHSILKNHGGTITVESVVGEGSVFTFFLPIYESEEKEDTSEMKTTYEWIQQKRKILILEDEEAVFKPLEKMLAKLNFSVYYVKTGNKAIEVYRNHYDQNDAFDIVILDLTIPGGIGGKETLKHLLEIDKNIKAIVSSGYASESTLSDFKEYGFAGVLKKPYDYTQLRAVLSMILGNNSEE